MTLVLTSGPGLEPVSLAEAKAHLRVEDDAEDTLIASLIVTSRLHIEAVLGMAFLTQEWSWIIDAWPDLAVLRLPLRPVQAITRIRIFGEDGSATSVPPDRYLLDGLGAPARLVRRRGRVWPQPGISASGIEIGLRVGFASKAQDVPHPLRQAVLLLVAHWYEHREPGELGSPAIPVPDEVSRLVAPYRSHRL